MRPDTARAKIVEEGIAMMAAGRRTAAAFMVALKVPDRVIARVLTDPGRRRAPVSQHSERGGWTGFP